MKVRYSRRALADLEEIADYIRARSPKSALSVERRIRRDIDLLASFPRLGRPTDDPEVRVLPVVKYPYLVYYEITGQVIVVHHIRHGARKPYDPGTD